MVVYNLPIDCIKHKGVARVEKINELADFIIRKKEANINKDHLIRTFESVISSSFWQDAKPDPEQLPKHLDRHED